MTPAGIEPTTFRFVAQHLNHCATAVPLQFRTVYDSEDKTCCEHCDPNVDSNELIHRPVA